MPNRYGGVGITLPLNQIGTNAISLQAGEVFYVPPGYYNLYHGPYSTIQTFDAIMDVWKPIGGEANPGSWIQLDSDGNNYRVANQTGCPVAAVLSAAGSGYTSAPTVTAAAGSSTWVAIIGGAISTTVTVVTGGTNYVYPPAVLVQAPNAGPGPSGIPATATSVISGGAVTSVTVLNQGAGYTTAPFISFVNDPRDTTGSGASAYATLTGSQTVTGVVCTNHGLPITSGTVPALTFTGGGGSSAAATIIMDWTATSYAVTGAGAGYVAGVEVTTIGTGVPTIAPAYTNPNSQASFFRGRPAVIGAPVTSGGVTVTGQYVIDGGHFASSASGTNNFYITTAGGGPAGTSTVATLTLGVGGVTDFLWIQAG